ncbi:MAG: hypothetical protein BWY83_03003 [bacterium ADurb.Bin478]|nr:MAG: hypothetical protein BWY83_03003 [bacterium ADurb.Bin478]
MVCADKGISLMFINSRTPIIWPVLAILTGTQIRLFV